MAHKLAVPTSHVDRYARQEILPQVGADGQKKLRDARILVVGAGGLGCPALQYLAGAGIGTLIVVDGDCVDASNLHRQPLYGEASLAQAKAQAAAAFVKNLNPQVKVIAHTTVVTPANVDALLAEVDVALDCADSFAATYILSDACLDKGIALIAASALGLTGYAGGFCASAPSVRAVFPDLPKDLATCATAGVLGPLVGMLGAMQAQMALSVLLRLTPSPLGQLVTLNAQSYRFGGFRFDGAAEPRHAAFSFIAATDITATDLVIELRGIDEAPQAVVPDAVRATVQAFEDQAVQTSAQHRTVLCCRSGLRAWRAAAALNQYSETPIALLAMGDEPSLSSR
jgi:sulfur-carrier protein adenylyltransferase/sulfurtransferase